MRNKVVFFIFLVCVTITTHTAGRTMRIPGSRWNVIGAGGTECIFSGLLPAIKGENS